MKIVPVACLHRLDETIIAALTQYKEEVEQGIFPGSEHGFIIQEQEVKKLGGKA